MGGGSWPGRDKREQVFLVLCGFFLSFFFVFAVVIVLPLITLSPRWTLLLALITRPPQSPRFTFCLWNWVAGKSLTMVPMTKREKNTDTRLRDVQWIKCCPLRMLRCFKKHRLAIHPCRCLTWPDWVPFGLNTAERHERTLYSSPLPWYSCPSHVLGFAASIRPEVSNFFFLIYS